MSATSEELASQAEQLQSAISYFRIETTSRQAANDAPVRKVTTPARRGNLRAEVMAKAPHMKKAALRTSAGGGFDLDLDESRDDLDSEFARRGAA